MMLELPNTGSGTIILTVNEPLPSLTLLASARARLELLVSDVKEKAWLMTNQGSRGDDSHALVGGIVLYILVTTSSTDLDPVCSIVVSEPK